MKLFRDLGMLIASAIFANKYKGRMMDLVRGSSEPPVKAPPKKPSDPVGPQPPAR